MGVPRHWAPWRCDSPVGGLRGFDVPCRSAYLEKRTRESLCVTSRELRAAGITLSVPVSQAAQAKVEPCPFSSAATGAFNTDGYSWKP
ncbi:hypothetical protein LZ32DRAFT_606372 [Colletotrichum eremochloae]|nr:hypothetical protein LZ32DRAFT_606372 [Colletotrichum eremochloae]